MRVSIVHLMVFVGQKRVINECLVYAGAGVLRSRCRRGGAIVDDVTWRRCAHLDVLFLIMAATAVTRWHAAWHVTECSLRVCVWKSRCSVVSIWGPQTPSSYLPPGEDIRPTKTTTITTPHDVATECHRLVSKIVHFKKKMYKNNHWQLIVLSSTLLLLFIKKKCFWKIS